MTKKILIPIDGSANSSIAIQYGIYVAQKLAASLTGLHVLDAHLLQGPLMTDITGTVGMPTCEGYFESIEASLNKKAEFILDEFCEKCKKGNLVQETRKVMGKIEEAIIEEARSADIIIMAKKGEHFHFKDGGLLGSVSEAVVRRSQRPVIVTPDRFIEIESMGVAYDGSVPAKKALDLSLELSQEANWPLTAVIITSDEKKGAKLVSQIEEAAAAKEIDCENITISGKVGEEIIKFIQAGSIELMAMGAYGHNRLRELLLGSSTSYVIQKSPIPVLLTH